MTTSVAKKVLLIGIDGADWNLINPLIEAEELPFIQQMIESGTMGNLATLSPTLSPILWNSIASGKRAGKHGISGFTEVDSQTGAVRPVSSLSRQCKAVWNILQQNGLNVNVVNWFAGHPAEPINGIAISDFFPNSSSPDPDEWPFPEGAVHPANRSEHYKTLRVHPDEVDADVGSLFIRDLDAIDRNKDQRPTQLGSEIARASRIQSAALEIIDHEPWDFLAVYFRTVDILCHLFMPFHYWKNSMTNGPAGTNAVFNWPFANGALIGSRKRNVRPGMSSVSYVKAPC